MFVEEYSQLIRHKPATMRSRMRHSLLDVLSAVAFTNSRLDELLQKPRVQFLYIHHVFRDEIAALENLLDHLSAHHSFISYSDAVNRILNDDIDKPYICLSSDDGLKNNLAAGEVLQSRGISACFFICPAMIGEADPQRIAAFTNERLHFPPVEFLTWNEVEQLQRQGHEIGGHTMNHVNVAQTSNEQLQYEIAACFDVIEQHCGATLHFAYPYGRYHHFTGQGRQQVLAAGFTSCASAERGCHVRGEKSAESLLIRRDHIILSWPWRHIRYFLAKNAKDPRLQVNHYPYAHSHSHQ